MKKRRTVVAVLMLILVSSILPAAEIRSALPALHGLTAILPSDSVLGQVGDDESCDAVSLLAKAFKEPYTFEWTETYLHESVRSSLVKLVGSWFSDNLPGEEMVFSVPYFNAGVQGLDRFARWTTAEDAPTAMPWVLPALPTFTKPSCRCAVRPGNIR